MTNFLMMTKISATDFNADRSCQKNYQKKFIFYTIICSQTLNTNQDPHPALATGWLPDTTLLGYESFLQ